METLRIEASKRQHFRHHLGYIRQWIDGFEAAGKSGPVAKDTLRQIQLWLDTAEPAVKTAKPPKRSEK